MSRKTLMFIIGIFTALGTFLATQFGIEVNFTAVGATALAIITYFQFQAKLDIKKIAQSDKYKDPKFWVSLVAIVIAQIGAFAGVELPMAEISAILTLLLTFLFGKVFKDNPV